MEEQVVLEGQRDYVSTKRIKVGTHTFASAKVDSVRLETEFPGRMGPVVAVVMGLPPLLVGGAAVIDGQFNGASLGCAGLGITFAGAGFIKLVFAKPTYVLHIGVGGTERPVLRTTSQTRARKLEAAVDDVIMLAE